MKFSQTVYDGLGEAPHGGPFPLQSVPTIHKGFLVLPPYGAAPTWGTATDASAWGPFVPIWSNHLLATEAAPTITTLLPVMAELMLLDLVAPHGAPTDTTWGHLPVPLFLRWPHDPTWGKRLSMHCLIGCCQPVCHVKEKATTIQEAGALTTSGMI